MCHAVGTFTGAAGPKRRLRPAVFWFFPISMGELGETADNASAWLGGVKTFPERPGGSASFIVRVCRGAESSPPPEREPPSRPRSCPCRPAAPPHPTPPRPTPVCLLPALCR